MNSTRLTIVTLMCAIGMVAVSLAVGRALYASDPWLLPGVCLTGLAIEVGLIRIVRMRGRSRAFWLGFVVCGLLAAGSFAWGMIVRNSVDARVNAATGELTLFPKTIFEQVGSISYTIWRRYLGVAVMCLSRLPFARTFMGPNYDDPVVFATAALMAGLPQLILAVAGGLLARQFVPPKP
jgi:hypothetical protein